MHFFCLLLLLYCVILATLQCASETSEDGLKIAGGIISDWWQHLCICQIYPLSFKAMKYSVGNLFGENTTLNTSQLCVKVEMKTNLKYFEEIEELDEHILQTCMILYGCNRAASDTYKYNHLREHCKHVNMQETSFSFYLQSVLNKAAPNDKKIENSIKQHRYKSVTMLASRARHRPMSEAAEASGTKATPTNEAEEEEGEEDEFNTMIALMLPQIAVTYHSQETGMENGEVSWEQGQDPGVRNGHTHPGIPSQPSSPDSLTPALETGAAYPEQSSGGERAQPEKRRRINNDSSYRIKTMKTTTTSSLYYESTERNANLKLPPSERKNCCDKVYRDLIETKMDPSRIRKQGFYTEVVNERVFSVMRDMPGNKTCMVIFNKGNSEEEIDLNYFNFPTKTLHVLELCSANITQSTASILTTTKIMIGPKATLVAEVGPLEMKLSTIWIKTQPEYSLPSIYFSTFILILSSYLLNCDSDK